VRVTSSVALFAAVKVRGGLPRDELQRVGGEAVAGRDGVRPADVLVEADADAGQAGELYAVGVELPGHRQVRLPEAQLALPGEVGVGDQQAAAVGRAVGADGPAVGRHRARQEVARPGRQRGRGLFGRRRGARVGAHRRGRLGGGDVVEQLAAAGVDGDRAGVGVDLDRHDLAHPVLAGAPPRDLVAPDLGEVGVPPVGEIGDQVAHLAGDLAVPVLLGLLVDADGAPRQVGVDVGVVLAGAEERGPLATDLDDLVGQVAGAVLAAGPALAEGDVAHRVAGDVGHATLGATDRGLVGVALADDVALRHPTVAPTVVGARHRRDRHEQADACAGQRPPTAPSRSVHHVGSPREDFRPGR